MRECFAALCFLSTTAILSHALHVRFDPDRIDGLDDNQNISVIVSVSLDSPASVHTDLRLSYRLLDERIADLAPRDLTVRLEFGQQTFNTSFVVVGRFLGITNIVADLSLNGGTVETSDQNVRLAVQRSNRTMDAVFMGTLVALFVVAATLMGCQMNFHMVYDVVKEPFPAILGFVLQFGFMPPMSYLLARWFFVDSVGQYALGLGLFASGCSPGGGGSNFFTLLLDGNVDLSIIMTFNSTLAALAMMPLWMTLLGSVFLHGGDSASEINIPYVNIIASLLILAIPLIFGMVLRHYRENLALKGQKALRPFIIFIIVFMLTFGIYSNLYMFRYMTSRVLLSSMLLTFSGYAFGFLVAIILRQPTKNVTALWIETGLNNTLIAIMLLKVSFPQPDADLASVIPVAVTIFLPIPPSVAIIVYWIYQFVKKRRKSEENDDKTVEKVEAVENGHCKPAESLENSENSDIPN